MSHPIIGHDYTEITLESVCRICKSKIDLEITDDGILCGSCIADKYENECDNEDEEDKSIF